MSRAHPIKDRLLRNIAVNPQTGCWEWTKRVARCGYPKFAVKLRTHNAHRVSYLTFVGPIPDGFEVDHLCQNPLCINPDHLEAVTKVENLRRIVGRKTHCKRGHPFDHANTRIYDNHRFCRACDRIRAKSYYPKRIARLRREAQARKAINEQVAA